MTTASLLVDIDTAQGKKQLAELKAELAGLADIPAISPKFNKRHLLDEVRYTLTSKKFDVAAQINSATLNRDIRAAIGEAMRYQYKVRIQREDLSRQVHSAVTMGLNEAFRVKLAGADLTSQIRGAVMEASGASVEIKAHTKVSVDTTGVAADLQKAVTAGVSAGVTGIKVPPIAVPVIQPVPQAAQVQAPLPSRPLNGLVRLEPSAPLPPQSPSALSSPVQRAVLNSPLPAPPLAENPKGTKASVSVSYRDPETGLSVKGQKLFKDGTAGYAYAEQLARQEAARVQTDKAQAQTRRETRQDARFAGAHLEPERRLDHVLNQLAKVQDAVSRGGVDHARHQYGKLAVSTLPSLAELRAQQVQVQAQRRGDQDAAAQSKGAQALAASRVKADEAKAQALKRAQEDALWASSQGPSKRVDEPRRPAGESAWRDMEARGRAERAAADAKLKAQTAKEIGQYRSTQDTSLDSPQAERAGAQARQLRRQITKAVDSAAVRDQGYETGTLKQRIEAVERAQDLAQRRGAQLAAQKTSPAAVRDIPNLSAMRDQQAQLQAQQAEAKATQQRERTWAAEKGRRDKLAKLDAAFDVPAAKSEFDRLAKQVPMIQKAAHALRLYGEQFARAEHGDKRVDAIPALQTFMERMEAARPAAKSRPTSDGPRLDKDLRYAAPDLDTELAKLRRQVTILRRAAFAERQGGLDYARNRVGADAVADLPNLPAKQAQLRRLQEEKRQSDAEDRAAKSAETARGRQQQRSAVDAQYASRQKVFEQARQESSADYTPQGARRAGAAALVAAFGEDTARAHLGKKQHLVDEIGSLHQYTKGANSGALATRAMRDALADAHSAYFGPT